MFRRKQKYEGAFLVLGEPESSHLVHQLHTNEDDMVLPVVVGRRYLCGNFIVEEYADPLTAGQIFMQSGDLEKEMQRG